MSIYFHILEREEIERLRKPLATLAAHREELLAGWFELYRRRFPEGAASSPAAMARIYGRDLDELLEVLLAVDMDRFASLEQRTGDELAATLPFAEIVAMLHLFEESCARVLERHAAPVPSETFLVLDKVSHCRMILFSAAYFASRDVTPARDRGQAKAAVRQGTKEITDGFHGLVGESVAIRKVIEQIRSAARRNGTVLITGESGTGKELVARALHAYSQQSRQPFVAVNCAALPQELIESELFGHRKGSFSGAQEEHMGLFRAADGGTLLLDEVTEMAPATQAKLLRVLQDRLVRPVGSTQEQPVTVRILASTNRRPEEAVKQGLLRQDLYYRLQAVSIDIPPLRKRLDDIPSLVDHFIARANDRLDRSVRGVHAQALEALSRHSWPGNVRELANTIEHAFTFGLGPLIGMLDLPDSVLAGQPAPAAAPEERPDALLTVAAAQRAALRKALEASGGNKLQAARLLGISRHGLYSKLKKLGMS